MLMSPDLEGRWILLMHHAHAFETTSLDLQGRELLLESFDELLAVPRLASSLEVIDVRTQDEHESFRRLTAGMRYSAARAGGCMPHVSLWVGLRRSKSEVL